MTYRQKKLLQRIVFLPFILVALVFVLVDDFFRAWVKPLAAWVMRWSPFAWLEYKISGWSAYATLLLFLIPMAIIEPIKLYALVLMTAHFKTGLLVFALAKIVGIALAERIFAISKDKLLTIRWFRWGYQLFVVIKDSIHKWLRKSVVWRYAARLVEVVKTKYRAIASRVGAWWGRK